MRLNNLGWNMMVAAGVAMLIGLKAILNTHLPQCPLGTGDFVAPK
jgi:hypothetical protein